jgi:hypothetical protein
MTKKIMDYSNTYFYKLVCKDPTILDCYVGHTTNHNTRKANHKTCCINEHSKHYNLYVYQFIRNNGGWNNWEMIIIECIPCMNSIEAHAIERQWLEILQATLNKQIPTRTMAEWKSQHKEQIAVYIKDWVSHNRDKKAIYNKNYRDKIKRLKSA